MNHGPATDNGEWVTASLRWASAVTQEPIAVATASSCASCIFSGHYPVLHVADCLLCRRALLQPTPGMLNRSLNRWLRWNWVPLTGLACGFILSVAGAEDVECFERRIRPVLVDRCYKCHSATSEKLKGGLRLDTRDG